MNGWTGLHSQLVYITISCWAAVVFTKPVTLLHCIDLELLCWPEAWVEDDATPAIWSENPREFSYSQPTRPAVLQERLSKTSVDKSSQLGTVLCNRSWRSDTTAMLIWLSSIGVNQCMQMESISVDCKVVLTIR